MAQQIELKIDQGVSWSHQLQLFKDDKGEAPIDDFTNTHFLMHVRKSVGSSRVMFTLADSGYYKRYPRPNGHRR